MKTLNYLILILAMGYSFFAQAAPPIPQPPAGQPAPWIDPKSIDKEKKTICTEPKDKKLDVVCTFTNLRLQPDPKELSTSDPDRVDIQVQITRNPNCNSSSGGETIFAQHGMAHSGETWNAFAEQMYKDDTACKVRQIVKMNLPGRGGSGLVKGSSSNKTFGRLGLNDYTNIIEQTLDGLQSTAYKPTTIVGHSMGGMLTALVQDDLKKKNSNLATKYGIKNVILLSPAITNPCPWGITESETKILGRRVGLLPKATRDAVGYTLKPEIKRGFVLNTYSEKNAKELFFTNREGTIPTKCTKESYKVPEITRSMISKEALNAANQMTRMNPWATRTKVDPGIFNEASGTQLTSLAGQEDVYMSPKEIQQMHRHLTTGYSCDPKENVCSKSHSPTSKSAGNKVEARSHGSNEQDNECNKQDQLRYSKVDNSFIKLEDPCATHDVYIANPKLVTDEVLNLFGTGNGKDSPSVLKTSEIPAAK
ncbi:MAG: alpha/beta hydrolase [Pseudobdellovibrionaceae bacterium]